MRSVQNVRLTPLRALLIGIAGGSGSGKTWLGERLAAAFAGQVARVSLDDFYRDRSHVAPGARGRINYDHPRAIDWGLLVGFVEDYRAALRGENSRKARKPEREFDPCEDGPMAPQYDFATHRRSGWAPCELKPVLVIEGLWTLARRELLEVLDVSIYVDCPAGLRLERRVARDMAERGRSASEVRAQFRERVEPMHEIYVAPQKGRAMTVLGHPVCEGQVEKLVAQLRATMMGKDGRDGKYE